MALMSSSTFLNTPQPDALLGSLGKPLFHLIDPGTTGRCEMEVVASHWQHRLAAVRRPHLAFLVDT